jgi:putative ABC transport system substrate-binding protein
LQTDFSDVRTACAAFAVATDGIYDTVVLITAPVHSDTEIETAIIALGREPGGGLVVPGDTFMVVHRAPIISAAARNNVPAVYGLPPFVRDGGLLSYATNGPDIFRRAASYVDRILRRAKPGDLPVQQPTKFELVINLKTAKALGLTIPETLLATADVFAKVLLRNFLNSLDVLASHFGS